MKNLIYFCSLFFVIFLFGSCAIYKSEPIPDPVDFSRKELKKRKISIDFLEGTQYQTGDDTLILLRKHNKGIKEKINYYETVFINGVLYEKIIFPPRTYCITRRDKIYFSKKDDKKIRVDSIEIICDFDPRETLMYKPELDPEGNFFLDYKKVDKFNLVDYGGKKYNAINPKNKLYFIPPKNTKITKEKYEKRIVPGRETRP